MPVLTVAEGQRYEPFVSESWPPLPHLREQWRHLLGGGGHDGPPEGGRRRREEKGVDIRG